MHYFKKRFAKKFSTGGLAEPQQWTNQQQALMGKKKEALNYNDLINSFHQTPGVPFKYMPWKAPVSSQAERAIKAKQAEEAKIMDENLIMRDEIAKKNVENIIGELEKKAIEQGANIEPGTFFKVAEQKQELNPNLDLVKNRLSGRSFVKARENLAREQEQVIAKREQLQRQIENEKNLANLQAQIQSVANYLPETEKQKLGNIFQNYQQEQKVLKPEIAQHSKFEKMLNEHLAEEERLKEAIEQERRIRQAEEERVGKILAENKKMQEGRDAVFNRLNDLKKYHGIKTPQEEYNELLENEVGAFLKAKMPVQYDMFNFYKSMRDSPADEQIRRLVERNQAFEKELEIALKTNNTQASNSLKKDLKTINTILDKPDNVKTNVNTVFNNYLTSIEKQLLPSVTSKKPKEQFDLNSPSGLISAIEPAFRDFKTRQEELQKALQNQESLHKRAERVLQNEEKKSEEWQNKFHALQAIQKELKEQYGSYSSPQQVQERINATRAELETIAAQREAQAREQAIAEEERLKEAIEQERRIRQAEEERVGKALAENKKLQEARDAVFNRLNSPYYKYLVGLEQQAQLNKIKETADWYYNRGDGPVIYGRPQTNSQEYNRINQIYDTIRPQVMRGLGNEQITDLLYNLNKIYPPDFEKGQRAIGSVMFDRSKMQ